VHSAGIRLLFVCTGNQHRSPMAQAILTRLLAARRTPAEIGSAGLLPGGRPLPAETRETLGSLGFDAAAIDAFRTREIGLSSVQRADLVLGLAREHVRQVVVLMPQAWERTFTFRELIRRGEALGPRRGGEPIATWLDRIGEGRQRSSLLGSSVEDDVLDPIGGSAGDFARTAQEIERLCSSLVSLVWPLDADSAGGRWPGQG